MNLSDDVIWLGLISQDRVGKYGFSNIPSRKESFGVAAIEAQACGTLMIYPDILGLTETSVLIEGNNSVAAENHLDLKETIEYLYGNMLIRRERVHKRGKF